MWKTLNFIKTHLTISIPVMMIAGLLAGSQGDMTFLKTAIYPFTFLMVYPMMVNLQINQIFSTEGSSTQSAAQIINFLIIPFVAFGLGLLFFPAEPMIRLGLLLAALLPTSGMTISWTGFAKGNVNAAVKMTVIGLIIGSLATPVYAKLLMGKVINIPMAGIFKQIAIVVFMPMVLGYITRVLLISKFGSERYNKSIKKKFPPLATIGVLGIVFVAMALKAESIISNPALLLKYLIPLILLYGLNFLISTYAGKTFFKREDGIALVYGTVMRNLSIALAIAMTVFRNKGAEIAVIIALAYIVQVQSAAWYVKYTDKIFGNA